MIIQRKPLQAIETIYNGYRFRSRLEARWAVFLDTLDVEYDYEPQGFYLDGACYLPDFWLPEPFGCWVEVKGKGKAPSVEELEKAQTLARYDKKNVYIFWGSIEIPTKNHDEVNNGLLLCGTSGYAVEGAGWYACTTCGFWGVGAVCKKEGHVVSTATPSLVTAFTAARQARFEHGETPQGRKVMY